MNNKNYYLFQLLASATIDALASKLMSHSINLSAT